MSRFLHSALGILGTTKAFNMYLIYHLILARPLGSPGRVVDAQARDRLHARLPRVPIYPCGGVEQSTAMLTNGFTH